MIKCPGCYTMNQPGMQTCVNCMQPLPQPGPRPSGVASMANKKGKVKKSVVEAHINSHTGLAMASALLPIPVVDSLAIMGAQVKMVLEMAQMYGKLADGEVVKGLVGTMRVSGARTAFNSFIKIIPGIGTAVGTSSQMLLAGALTWSMGNAFQNHFDQGGSLQDAHPETLLAAMVKLNKRGKKRASKLAKLVKQGKYGATDPQSLAGQVNQWGQHGYISVQDVQATLQLLRP